MSANIELHLTRDEGIVLYDFLRKINKSKCTQNAAQMHVCSAIECELEILMSELFNTRFESVLNKATGKLTPKISTDFISET
jgi:hypothetical protein